EGPPRWATIAGHDSQPPKDSSGMVEGANPTVKPTFMAQPHLISRAVELVVTRELLNLREVGCAVHRYEMKQRHVAARHRTLIVVRGLLTGEYIPLGEQSFELSHLLLCGSLEGAGHGPVHQGPYQ